MRSVISFRVAAREFDVRRRFFAAFVVATCICGFPAVPSRAAEPAPTAAPRDFAAEFQAALMRAEAGSPGAIYRVAQLYNAGLGTPASPADYRVWLERAAMRGHPYAQFELGMNLEMGFAGFPADPVAGFGWTLRAARQGQPPAFQRVAADYASGTGTMPDPEEAYFWQLVAVNTDAARLAEYQAKARKDVADEGMILFLTEILKAENGLLDSYRIGLSPAVVAAISTRAMAFAPKPEL